MTTPAKIADSLVKPKKPFKERPIVPDPTEEDGGRHKKDHVDWSSEIVDASSPPTQVITTTATIQHSRDSV